MTLKKLIDNAKKVNRFVSVMAYANKHYRIKLFLEKKTMFLDKVYTNVTLNQRLYHFIYDCGIKKCNHCDNPTNYRDRITKGYYKTCGNKECHAKEFKQTNLINYGVESVMNIDSIKKKHEDSCFKNYGSKSYLGTRDAVNKRKEKDIQNFKDSNPSITKVTDSTISLICEDCKNEVELPKYLLYNRTKYRLKVCTICNPVGSYWSSNGEDEIVKFLEDIGITNIVRRSKKIVKYHEIDIYLPDYNIGIEFNGLYWHSEVYKAKDYHLEKTNSSNKYGIKLIHIWEDDWNFKMDIVKSRLKNLLKMNDVVIYARKCKIRSVDSKIERSFLELNHLQGYVASNYKIGLFYDNELVSLMTFSKPRRAAGQKSKNGPLELLRMCNKLNTNVVGASSKLLKHFLNKCDLEEFTELITYADRSWSSKDSVYEKIGFEFIGSTAINYYYIFDRKRKHRYGFTKQKLVAQGADPNKTEKEIMFEKKIFRIYDCGSFKYILKI